MTTPRCDTCADAVEFPYPYPSDVIAVLELRISLETAATGLAAQRRTDANLDAMQAALRAFQSSIEMDSDAVPSDFQFHMEVAPAISKLLSVRYSSRIRAIDASRA